MEIWKDIDGYDGIYQVSNNGKVKRIQRYRAKPSWLIQATVKSGYKVVALWKNNSGRTFYVHALVCSAFHGVRPNGAWCNHKDGNKSNNRADNLEWVTPYENEHHAMECLGKSNAGERNGRSKLTEDQVKKIRCFHECGMSIDELSTRYSVNRRTIFNIVHLRSWRHI